MMKVIGKHKNIINLLGACTQGGGCLHVRQWGPPCGAVGTEGSGCTQGTGCRCI